MKQIIVIGDNSSSNLGDPILTQSAYYTVCRAVEGMDYVVSIFDIAGRKKQKSMTPIPPPPTHKYTQIPSVTKASSFSVLSNCIKVDVKCLVKWYLREKKQFKKRLESSIKSESVTFVIAGGALISSSLFYALRLNAIVNIAKRYNSRVIFNAVGIEKTVYNYGMAKYIVRHYLKQPQVVAFSTRDHVEDIPYLTNREDFQLLLPDPGLFAAEAFGVKRKKSDTIGLSVISYQAYQSVMFNDERACNLSPDDLLSFWEGILKGFITKGKKFKILTNGGPKDYEMALRLCQRMNLDTTQYLLPMATEPRQLVEQLSCFKLVIAHRLHALIICTSLGIPVIPIVWSDKVAAFAKIIDNPYVQWPSANNNINEIVETFIHEDLNVNLLQAKIKEYIKKSIMLSSLY